MTEDFLFCHVCIYYKSVLVLKSAVSLVTVLFSPMSVFCVSLKSVFFPQLFVDLSPCTLDKCYYLLHVSAWLE